MCELQENASLKMEVLERGSRVEDQDPKTDELLEQRHVILSLILVSSYQRLKLVSKNI